MASIVHGYKNFISLLDSVADDRSSHLPGVNTIHWPLGILIVYSILCGYVGPAMMKNRKPFKLHNVLLLYNIMQIAINLYFPIKAYMLNALSGDNLYCNPIDTSDRSYVAMEVVKAAWVYYASRVIDVCDTIFIILKKNDRQNSVLHRYHHALMILGSWMGIRFVPGGHAKYFALINSAVHVVMYSHYLITALFPKVVPWWKKYLTQMQLVQFVMVFLFFGETLLQPSCTFPNFISISICVQSFIMFWMFLNFYIKNYSDKKIR